MVHSPPQHWESLLHESPAWRQNDEGAQRLPEQKPEQHPEFAVHDSPRTEHVVLREVQVFDVPQVPLQHCALLVHAWPVATHAGTVHTFPLQFWLQHWLAVVHAAPTLRQVGPVPESVPASVVPPPHLSNPPPPQYCGLVQVWQLSWFPQPSPAKPQL